jgi:hypothetical protein
VYGSRELAAAVVQFRSSSSYSHAPGARDQLFHCRRARGIQFHRGRGRGPRPSIQAQHTRAKTQGQSTFQGNQTYSHKPLDSKDRSYSWRRGVLGAGVLGGRDARWLVVVGAVALVWTVEDCGNHERQVRSNGGKRHAKGCFL